MKTLITTIIFLLLNNYLLISAEIRNMKCCNSFNPLGVEKPLLSWQIISSERGYEQTAWQIEMASTKDLLNKGKADIWKSGKVLSSEMFDIIPQYSQLQSTRRYWWRVRVWNKNDKTTKWSSPSCFTMGLLDNKDWKAKWITADWTAIKSLPYFRKDIVVKQKDIASAIVYICGLGCSDLFVNGEYADSTRIIDPAQTNYDKYALYSSIDVTSKVKHGNNCLGVMLGNVWFNQNVAFSKSYSYGKPMLKAELHVEYKDGSKDIFITDESWLYKGGPLISSNIYQGEVYDSRIIQKNWNRYGADVMSWKAAVIANKSVPPRLLSYSMPPIRMHSIRNACKLWKSANGTWIYDFGQNNTSNILINASLPKGISITIKTGEEINADTVDFRSSGIKVSPVQTDIYISNGEKNQKWTPRTTYHGFRYAQLSISDSTILPKLHWLKAIDVHSDLADNGYFECSNEQINHLHELARRTFLANMQGVPLDCPQREKCGWLGDVHSYIKMALMNSDANNFFVKYLNDIRSTSEREEKNALNHLHRYVKFYTADKPSGIPYQIAPGKRLCGVASPEWGTTVVQIPWYLYLYCGNKLVLSDFYESMKKWTDFITSLSIDHIVYHGMGDWCPPLGRPGIDTPLEFSSSAFHYLDVSIMEKVAKLLGKEDDYIRYGNERKNIKNAIINKFYNPLINSYGSQTADAMALDFGLYNNNQNIDIAKSIVNGIKAKNNFFYTGIFGLERIGRALSRNHQQQKAWEMFTKKGEYSFEWMWKKADATTLWEILPISRETMKITDTQSHSHPMQGGYDVWFFEDLAGTRPYEKEPGFKTVVIDPLFDLPLSYVKGEHVSRYGKIKSYWNKNNKNIEWNVDIPIGSSALIAIPINMMGKDKSIGNIRHIYPTEFQNDGKDYIHIPSGSYTLLLENKN